MEQLKRSALQHYLNISPKTTARYALMGEGISDLGVNMNPESDTQQWIHQDSGTTTIKSYVISLDATQVAMKGDDVYDFVDELGYRQAVYTDASTDIIEVRLYEESGSVHTAKKWKCNIAVNNYGGASTDPLGIEYTINIEGDPIFGTFNVDTLTFTEESSAGGGVTRSSKALGSDID